MIKTGSFINKHQDSTIKLGYMSKDWGEDSVHLWVKITRECLIGSLLDIFILKYINQP
jgi:hypothetical protein